MLNLLVTAPWYGNIRELQSFVEKVCVDAIFTAGKTRGCNSEITLTKEIVENRLTKKIMGLDCSPSSPISPGTWPQFRAGEKMEEYLEKIETELLNTALENHNHNRTRAARDLGISRSGLLKKLKRLGH